MTRAGTGGSQRIGSVGAAPGHILTVDLFKRIDVAKPGFRKELSFGFIREALVAGTPVELSDLTHGNRIAGDATGPPTAAGSR